MKTQLLLAGTLLMNLSLNAQSANATIQHDDKVVINEKMVARFNEVEFTAETVNFGDLYAKYSFDEVKSVMLAYRTGDIEQISPEKIDNYLADNSEKPEPAQAVTVLNNEILVSEQQTNLP